MTRGATALQGRPMVGRRILIVLLFAGCVVTAGVGCATGIVPPRVEPAHAARVVVADYGYHSTLIFPNSAGGLTEYAYGDWTYFALNQHSFLNAIRALFWSEQATLGRRVITQSVDDPGFGGAIGAVGVLKFDVPRDKVRDLERTLDGRYETSRETMFFSVPQQLWFVRDPDSYGAIHNCNRFTARGLEQLGCRIRGLALTSKFELATVEDEPTDQRAGATTRPALAPH